MDTPSGPAATPDLLKSLQQAIAERASAASPAAPEKPSEDFKGRLARWEDAVNAPDGSADAAVGSADERLG